jgi:hypothetical protein
MRTIDNDTASCYDRIICYLAMLLKKYYGVPETSIVCFKQIILGIQFIRLKQH